MATASPDDHSSLTGGITLAEVKADGSGSDRIADLLVVTPWYPRPDAPYAGNFVKDTVEALSSHADRITVIHVENRPLTDERTPQWSQGEYGPVFWIPVPMDPLTSRHDMMVLQRQALVAHASHLLREATVVHAHTGAPTGAAVAPLLPANARLVLTEHASYLSRVAKDHGANVFYRQLLARADAVTAVSHVSAARMRALFPADATEVLVVPNPVALDGFVRRAQAPATVNKWLYVGNLIPLKSVDRLLNSFAAALAVASETDAEQMRLTIAGGGVMADELAVQARELGIADRVDFLGAVPPDRVKKLYAEHDLLVHLSKAETFGVTCVEAAASGMAVLVTSCGGPEETMAVPNALGLSEFVAVSEDPEQVDDVLAALAQLRQTVPGARVELARRHLEQTVSEEVVGERFRQLLTGNVPPPPPPVSGLRVWALALSRSQCANAERLLSLVSQFGGGGVLVTTQVPEGPLPPQVRVVDISKLASRFLISRAERLVILHGPGLALRVARGAARASGATSADALLAKAQVKHRAGARWFRRGPYATVWRDLGPYSLAKMMEREGIYDYAADCDLVVHYGELSIPMVVRLLRKYPQLEARRHFGPIAAAGIYVREVLSKQADDELVVVDTGPGDVVADPTEVEATSADLPWTGGLESNPAAVDDRDAVEDQDAVAGEEIEVPRSELTEREARALF